MASGPYGSVTGTFTVPYITTAATCSELTSEWVGLDGLTNSSLVQAGVTESSVDPVSGACSSQYMYVWAWWEILPAASTAIPLAVSPGDSITVSIYPAPTPGDWVISITDATTGQNFSTTQAYSGPTTSAEWVVEAPSDGPLCGGQCLLAPYEPQVSFSGLGYQGAVSVVDDISMNQQNYYVSVPSAVPYWPSDFSVQNTDIAGTALANGLPLRAFAPTRGGPSAKIFG